ncbi:MAG: hypothetical protein RSB82_04390 [Victivallaceae bacterium]
MTTFLNNDHPFSYQGVNGAIDAEDRWSVRSFSDSKVQRLNILGIVLSIVGLLLVAMGIAMTVALSGPLFVAIFVIGMALTVISGILLIKVQRIGQLAEESVDPIEKNELHLEEFEECERIGSQIEPKSEVRDNF